jgi:hypothetical protein
MGPASWRAGEGLGRVGQAFFPQGFETVPGLAGRAAEELIQNHSKLEGVDWLEMSILVIILVVFLFSWPSWLPWRNKAYTIFS